MHLVDGVKTGLTWPSIELRAGADADGQRRAAARRRRARPRLAGASPTAVVDLALELGVPHGRRARAPTRRRSPTPGPPGSSPPPRRAELADRAGFVRGRSTCRPACRPPSRSTPTRSGCPSVGLWAQVPHYAVGHALPGRRRGPARGARRRSPTSRFGTGDLADEAASARVRLDELVADSDEHQQLVRQLEAQVDAVASADGGGPCRRATSWPRSSSASSATRTPLTA